MDTEDLLVKIESHRSKMVKLGLSSSFLDERVVKLSYELDKLLNKYQAVVCRPGKR
ncbi:aspartyl-phosphate phosphatase Spo0E family protein [Bacillus sp. FJAT-49732]|uniref:Aspartyl-phosphate phosphatase Spo0E family protein n=1 Tax=Lederbergia citrisecunda TaxID=2833583 RepID=A0A942TTU5_9BACI|nr:aspartyl-phosphate phosphatase Spo0E family protein [Lederbergia citrisecunda]MBS4201644.1 aspartyl-phosphate phosphatase Spo0E family protein [Lederbergia citrisecunda]